MASAIASQLLSPGDAAGSSLIDPAAVVRAALDVPEAALDYGAAKLAFDRLIDPATADIDVAGRLDQLEATARRLAGPGAGPDARLAALRRSLYEPGPWNEGRPFAYDQADPLGYGIANKLLANYLTTRRGNCVSMPALMLILGERLGLPVALAQAPAHVFLRYRDERGREHNLETTSGAHPARDAWYREQMPMSDRSVASGLYLSSLSRPDGVALLATTVLEHLRAEHRWQALLDTALAILAHVPRDATSLIFCGLAYEQFRMELADRFSSALLVPPLLRVHWQMLVQRRDLAFDAALALGWEEGE